MQLLSTNKKYGLAPKIIHWTSAALFIASYVVVYFVIWFMDDMSADALPVLNVHWALGLLLGALVIPRRIFAVLGQRPQDLSASPLEHAAAKAVHFLLYGLLISMSLTGYLGTGAPTNFGLFEVPGFNETYAFNWLSQQLNVGWKEFEAPVDVIHHFLGKWVAWGVVAAHIAAALYHHFVRQDDVLKRMLPSLDRQKGV